MLIKKIAKNNYFYLYILYGCICLIFIIAARFVNPNYFGIKCMFKALFKIPCPTCGTYRVFYHLAYLDLKNAFLSNPLIFIGIIILILLFVYSIAVFALKLPKYELVLSDTEKKYLLFIVIFFIIANWIYLIIAKI